jgi:hypothetical protein
MNTTEAKSETPASLADLETAIRALSKPRDPQAMREASARMDRMREELRVKHGEMELAVDLIRHGRDAE